MIGLCRLSCAALIVLFLSAAAPVLDRPATMSPDAYAELSAAVEILKSHHINSGKADWPKLEAQAFEQAANAQKAADTYPAIQFLIDQLGEKHTFFSTPDRTRARMTGKPSGDARPNPPVMPEAEISRGIAYLMVPAHEGPPAGDLAYAQILRDAIGRFHAKGVCRYIVDLRNNAGGNMGPMIAGVAPLLGDAPYGYWVEADGTSYRWPNSDRPLVRDGSYVEAYGPDTPALPGAAVAVLINRYSSSAAEFTAIAFEGRPHTRFFGEPSAGRVTGNSVFMLPDEASIAVSGSRATDRLQRPVLGPLTPDEATPNGEATRVAAETWLQHQRCALK